MRVANAMPLGRSLRVPVTTTTHAKAVHDNNHELCHLLMTSHTTTTHDEILKVRAMQMRLRVYIRTSHLHALAHVEKAEEATGVR
jgi:hypothetical protein